MFNNLFFRKSSPLRHYVTARYSSEHNVIRHTHFACRITKATNTRSEYNYIYNTYYFSTANMITRKRLNVTFITKLPVLQCTSTILVLFYFYDLLYIMLSFRSTEHTHMKYVRKYAHAYRTYIHIFIRTYCTNELLYVRRHAGTYVGR